MKDIILCQYGCGQEAKFKTKGGKNICSKSPNSCPANRKKNSQSVKKAHQKEPEKWMGHLGHLTGFASKQWKDNNLEQYQLMHKQAGETYKRKLKNGQLIYHWTGKKHTLQTRQKMSKNAALNSNGHVRTKYYDVYCPHENKFVKVQGTWQLKYAEYLNKNNINWIRSRKINLKYRLHEDDYLHTYYPDFYLPDTDQYIEIKGYWWKSQDGSVDDKRKMQKVIEYNNDKKIAILTKVELKKLNII